MPPTQIPRPYLGEPFSTPAAIAAGISRNRFRNRDLEAPFRGVRAAAGSTNDLVARCRAYLVRAGHEEFFSHTTAARLWGIPLPMRWELSRELHISVFAPAHPPQSAGVAAHRISHEVPLRSRLGLPCAPPAETWLQLGALLTLDDLIVAADSLMRRKRPLADLNQLQVAARGAYRRPGVRALRAALREARPGTDSPQETRARLIIVRAGLPEPVIGYTVYNQNGHFVGTPDLAYPEFRIALEYEGDGHRTDDRVFADDIERAELFQEATWRYVRLTKTHVDHPHRLVSRVRNVLLQRGWQP